MYQKNYSTARTVLGIVSIAGWAFVVIGAIVFLASIAGGGAQMMLLLPGAVLVASGLVLVAMAQVSFAVLDQADISQESLLVLRGIASKQGVDISAASSETKPEVSSKPRNSSQVVTLSDGTEVRTYLGTDILKKDGKYFVDEVPHSSLGKAKDHIQRSQTNGAAAS